MVEPEELSQRARTFIKQDSQPRELFSWNEVRRQLAVHKMATIHRLASGDIGAHWQMPIESIERFSGDYTEIRKELDRIAVRCA